MAIPSASTPSSNSFMARCLRGEVKPEDIHRFIIDWNAGPGTVPIQVHLGMTDQEWSLYMEAEGNLERILRERRTRHLHKPPTPVRHPGRRF